MPENQAFPTIFPNGAKGEDVELGGLPFNKRVNHQVAQLSPAYLSPVLGVEERRHQLVVV